MSTGRVVSANCVHVPIELISNPLDGRNGIGDGDYVSPLFIAVEHAAIPGWKNADTRFTGKAVQSGRQKWVCGT